MQPLPNFGLHQDLSNLNVKLIDYGSGKDFNMLLSRLFKLTRFTTATYVAKGPGKGDIQPILLCTLEVILGQLWPTPVDIWFVGCLVRVSLLLSSPAHQETVL